MDSSRFDELTKALATATSRRQALKAIAATLGGLLGLSGGGLALASNMTCAQWCEAVFGENTPADEQCSADAAHHTGLCYSCGPASPGGGVAPSAICCTRTSSGSCSSYSSATCCGSSATCLNGSCCPTANVCGSTCLAAPCDSSQCLTCDSSSGTCVSSCTSGQSCVNGTCCPTGQVCFGMCCPSGQSCVEGVCCPNSQVCNGIFCCFPPSFCLTGGDCPGECCIPPGGVTCYTDAPGCCCSGVCNAFDPTCTGHCPGSCG